MRFVRLITSFALCAAWLLAFDAGDAGAQTVPRPVKKGTKYTVKIDSSPQQAAIYLDDKQYGIVGYTPYRGLLVKGSYKLILELQGYKPVSVPINVSSSSREFFYPLEKGNGSIDVQTGGDPNVAGATIYVDGESKGTAPNGVDLAEGRHLVELKKAGFGDFSQWVTLKAGERVTMTPVLKGNTKGSLLIDADVAQASVVVDGKKLEDTTPAIVDALDEGPHIVEVTGKEGGSWKQTVYVKAGQRNKVTAELKANAGVTIRVLANAADAEIFVDGTSRGKAPLDVAGLAPGQHILESKAKGYADKEQTITVEAGKSLVVKMDMVQGVSGPAGKLKIISPIPAATVFIDGASVGNAPFEKEVSAGEHLVVVEHEGFARFERKVTVAEGATLSVTADLRAVGAMRFLSSPDQATVVLDGAAIGKTPLVVNDIAVGEHVIIFRHEGFREYTQTLTVQGGQSAIMNAPLQPIDQLTPEEEAEARRGQTSYGAGTVPPGRVTIDVSAGYPYWLEARATTGIPLVKPIAMDVAVTFRTLIKTYEFLLTGRVRFVKADPFAVAAFATIGGGGGADGRNQLSFQAGGIGTILFAKVVSVSARLFIDVWSDRLCSQDKTTNEISGTDACKNMASAVDQAKATDLFGSGNFQDRTSGARFYTSLVTEVGLSANLGFFVVVEGAPFQKERAAFTNLFTSTMLKDTDPIYNLRAGFTFKF